MPAPRTEITEITTGLALFGHADVEDALAARPDIVGVEADDWGRLGRHHRSGDYRAEFLAAWANGRAFLNASDALRGRPPARVEWKGNQRTHGDDAVPADLRVDHVYLISCKHLSKVLANASPTRLFDAALGPGSAGGTDWFEAVAPEAHQRLWEVVRRAAFGGSSDLPPHVTDVTPEHRRRVRERLRHDWPVEAREPYVELAGAVSRASAGRWKAALGSKRDRERMLWRLLRLGPAPYFVLGVTRRRSLRLRVLTPWDWRQRYDLRRFDVWGDDAGQPQVRWRAEVRDREEAEDRPIEGHVEVRWSHGRFGGPPEAKVYLDTEHHRVPGYEALV